MAPAVIVKVQGEQNVQPLAGLAFIDDELDRLVRERRVTRDIGQMLTYLSSRLPVFGASVFGASVFGTSGFGASVFAGSRLRSVRLRRLRFRRFRLRRLPASGIRSSASAVGFTGSVGVNDGSGIPDRTRATAFTPNRRRRHERLVGRIFRQGPRFSNWLRGLSTLGLGVYWASVS